MFFFLHVCMCVRLFHLTVCVCRSRFATFVGVYVQFLHSTRAVRWQPRLQELLVAQVVPEVEVIHLTHGANLRWWTTFLLLRPSRRKRKMSRTWQTSAVVNARSAARWSIWGKADAPIRLVYLGIIISNSFKFFQNCFQETFQGFSLVFFSEVCLFSGVFLCLYSPGRNFSLPPFQTGLTGRRGPRLTSLGWEMAAPMGRCCRPEKSPKVAREWNAAKSMATAILKE